MRLPLKGIRVIELTMWVQGPIIGALLGRLGADVIKIETPRGGDPQREYTVVHDVPMVDEHGLNLAWQTFNTNKLGMTLDLKAEAGKQVLHRLVAKSDVFLTNLRRQALPQLGADKETLERVNPRLIYAVAEGLGSRGPRKDDACNDSIGMGYAGFLYTASPSSDPYYPPGNLSDILTGTLTAFGVVTALLARQRDPESETIEVSSSQLQALAWLQLFNISAAANLGKTFQRLDRTATAPLYNIYKCQDGRWIVVGTPQPDRHWKALCEAIGAEDLVEDPDFDTMEARSRNRRRLIEKLDAAFETAPSQTWLMRLRQAGIWGGPVKRIEELVEDDHMNQEGYLAKFENGLRFVTGPFSIDGVVGATEAAPEFGQHTDEILRSMGYSEPEITELRIAGVIW